MNRTKASSSLPPIPELPDYQMESPTYSQSSCDTSETHWGAGSWAEQKIDEDYLPLLVKDTKLQLYFLRMELALRPFHPAAIQAEAVNLTREIVAKPTEIASSIQTVAETLARAGYRKVESSRSCALIALEVFYQLRSISESAGDSFRGCLIGAVMKVFEGYYLKVFLLCFLGRVYFTLLMIGQVNLWHLGGLNGLSSVDEEMINVAGFAGDLFALGLLSVGMVHGSILTNLAYANQVSTIHCRALHLFLLHAKASMGPLIGSEVLHRVRKQLVRCSRGPPMVYDTMAQLWVIVSFAEPA